METNGEPVIVITKRTDDYHACIKGEPGVWGCGKSSNEAIGHLVSGHRERFGVQAIECLQAQ